LFDDIHVWIGSFNLDPRSAALNTEAALLIRDRALAIAVKKSIMRDVAPKNSWTIGERRKVPIWNFINGAMENLFMPFYHPDFSKHYQTVGPFPEMKLSIKMLKTRLTKAFFGPAQPII